VFAAAALGDLERVKRAFPADGPALPFEGFANERRFTHGRPFDSRHVLEVALTYAAYHGRRDVVVWLLARHPDLDVREPAHGGTPLGMAKYPHASAGRPQGSPEIALLIEAARR
jgi:hypothetical protein